MHTITIMNKYISFQNDFFKNRQSSRAYEVIEELLQDFFNKRSATIELMDFAYAVDLTNYRVCYQDRLLEYLEYPSLMSSFKDIRELLHPNEQEELLRFYRQWYHISKKVSIKSPTCRFKITHQIKKGDHSYLRILHYIVPVLINAEQDIMVYINMCIDITKHSLADGITTDFNLLYNNSSLEREMISQLESILQKQDTQFTHRELEVLKVWSEMPSVEMASAYLKISKRTFTTHLRNMRKKIKVHRTVDVMFYVKEKGWM